MANQWALTLADGFSLYPFAIVFYLLIALPVAIFITFRLLEKNRRNGGKIVAAVPLALLAGVVPISFGELGATLVPLWLYALFGVSFLPFALVFFLFWEAVCLVCVALLCRMLKTAV